MSRGLGRLQRDIRDYLAAASGPITFETMRWGLFEHKSPDASSARLRNGKLPGSWNSSLSRALDGLAAGNSGVTIERRRLESIDEFVEHYPGKSLVAKTRQLRIGLLPGLARIAGTGKHAARYSMAENERWYLKTVASEKIAELQGVWRHIEPELVRQLTHVHGEDTDHLFFLIARAKSLFASAPLECNRSIAQCLRPLVEHGALPPAMLKTLTELSESLVPSAQVGFLGLKTFIRTFVDIPRTGSGYRLKPETLNALEDTCPQVVQTLPGYEPPRPRRGLSPFAFHHGPRSTHGTGIHKLIDKAAFAKFVFVRMA